MVSQVNQLGFNWVKVQVPWKDIEGNPGDFGWGGVDSMVNTFKAGGLNVLLSVPKAPTWARPPGADLSVEGPPADPATFANFLGQMAGRYCGTVKAIEVWNEQNLHYEWGNQPLDPAGYMAHAQTGLPGHQGSLPLNIRHQRRADADRSARPVGHGRLRLS